jgi:AAA15 family ATPase/GTPase
MKLRCLKAKNVLSFGDEGIELEFNPYNVIVGPNDSGKTNLFRVLNLIEKTFDYRTPSLARARAVWCATFRSCIGI